MSQRDLKKAIQQTVFQEVFPTALSKADKRRLAILEGAIKTYASLGVEYVSYEDIARNANTSRPLILHYFPEKKDLFATSMKLIRAQFQALAIRDLQQESTFVGKFSAYVRATFNWLREYPEHARAWLLFFYLCPQDAELKTEHVKMTTMGQERIAALLELGNAQGDCRSHDPKRDAKLIQRTITGAFMEIVTEKSTREIEEASQDTVDACLKLVEVNFKDKGSKSKKHRKK